MIPSNLKVGDVFTDEFTFRVIKVNEDGTYISERVKGAKPVEDIPVVEMPVEEVKEDIPSFTKTQINRMPNAELEKVCKDLGIAVGTGTEMKRAIINKLEL